MKFDCPHCGEQLEVGTVHIGRVLACPVCSFKISVPHPHADQGDFMVRLDEPAPDLSTDKRRSVQALWEKTITDRKTPGMTLKLKMADGQPPPTDLPIKERELSGADADFKLLISPTPMVGPDYSTTKIDNHVNPGGFLEEGRAFFRWLSENDVKNFYIFCGDRHWQYHSVHPTGYEEFGCGAISDPHASSRPVIPIPGVKQMHTGYGVGGFLHVDILGEGREIPEITITLYNNYILA